MGKKMMPIRFICKTNDIPAYFSDIVKREVTFEVK